jgi:hypothetical protein
MNVYSKRSTINLLLVGTILAFCGTTWALDETNAVPDDTIPAAGVTVAPLPTVPVPLSLAQAVPPEVHIDTATPQMVLSLADGIHPLDNAMPATFRDSLNGEWFIGATTAIYKKYYLSADTGWAQPIDNSQHGLYLVACRAYVGQLLVDRIPKLSLLPRADVVTRSLVKYLTAGAWVARDFSYTKWRAGEYVGFEIKLDYLNWFTEHIK